MNQKLLITALGTALALAYVSSATTAPPKAPKPDPNRVLIQFKPGAKAGVQAALRAAGARVHHQFDQIDTLAATVPARALEGLRRNPNVVLVEPDQLRYPSAQTVPYGIDDVQARDVWDADRDGAIDVGAPTGQGITVCVIDSGINVAHEDFAGVNIIGGTPGNKWKYDNCAHGTHVAGTIAAASNDTGVVGVSPGKVSLFIAKVFGDETEGNCVWSRASELMNAAAQCADAGAKVINMSLSGGASKAEQKMFDNLYRRGILSVAAAGNHGNPANPVDPYVYPSSYDSVVSAGATDVNRQLASFSAKNDQVELTAPGVNVLSTVPYLDPVLVSGGETYEASPLSNTFKGSATAELAAGGLCGATDAAWSGKVVLCQRGGGLAFLVKAQNAYQSGAKAVVIANNVEGAPNFTLGDDLSVIPPIPVTGVTLAIGNELLAEHIAHQTTVDTVVQWGVSNYDYFNGTSMATPHVAGVAALIWSANPSWSNVQIREAMGATAVDLGAPGYDTSFGWGLVQAKAALDELQGH